MHSRKAGFSATVSPLALIILASMLGADRRIGVGPAQDIDAEGIRTNLRVKGAKLTPGPSEASQVERLR